MSPTEAATAAESLRSLMGALFEDLNEAVNNCPGVYFKYPIEINTPIPTNADTAERLGFQIKESFKVAALTVAEVLRLTRTHAVQLRESRTNSTILPPPSTKPQSRYYELAAVGGYALLSILAFSPRFRDAATHLGELKWGSFLKSILEHKRSFEFFAYSHRVAWREALQYYDKPFGSTIPANEVFASFDWALAKDDHPHNWYLPLRGPPQRKKWGDMEQINVEANIFDPKKHPNLNPPGVDPLTRREIDGPCMICLDNRIHNDCIAEDIMVGLPGFPVPLVELAEMPGKGIGIRALANYKKEDWLGEYKGEVIDREDEGAYTYRLAIRGDPNDDDGDHHPGRGDICEVDGMEYGSWTRFLNHSCDESSEFRYWREGNRIFNVVYVTKDINIFDEMTIHYGDEYFKTDVDCLCGTTKCEWSAVMKAKKKSEAEIARLKEKEARIAKTIEEEMEKFRQEEEEAETDHEEEGEDGGEEEEEGKEVEEGEEGDDESGSVDVLTVEVEPKKGEKRKRDDEEGSTDHERRKSKRYST